MRREYVRPVMVSEQFTPNEYCNSECGASGKVYKFECNAGSKHTTYNVFLNGKDGQPDTADDIAWSTSSRYDCINDYPFIGFERCSADHSADSDSGFELGYMYEQSSGLFNSGYNTGDRIDVMVWTDNGTNTHCTEKLDISSWEVLKS